MARILTERDESGIRLLTLEASEGELLTYALALRHLLGTLAPDTVEEVTGAYVDEVEGFLSDLTEVVDLAEWESADPLLVGEPA